jgi:hypothetical protein
MMSSKVQLLRNGIRNPGEVISKFAGIHNHLHRIGHQNNLDPEKYQSSIAFRTIIYA